MSRLFGLVFLLLMQIANLSIVTAAEDSAQLSTDNLAVLGRIHFNTQTSDFDRSRAFYRQLGYTRGINTFPKTNTAMMAQSLGMYDLCTYELQSIEVMNIPNASGPTSIDLIQFAIPYNGDPPYALPNHLGMAYAALSTANFAQDYAYLKEQGVEFLSAPYGVLGERFVFMRDPDGVYLKLIESTTLAEISSENQSNVNIQAMPYIGINVSDFDESLKFYRSLGYSEVEILSEQGSLAEAQAYGLDRPFTLRGADISLPNGDRNTLRIMQWIEPFDPSPPYPAPINHIGIHRIALAVQNLDATVKVMKDQGVDFLSEIAPCCSGTGQDETGIVNAIDPDGVFVELVGPIRQRPQQPEPAHCSEPSQTLNWYYDFELFKNKARPPSLVSSH